jgi:16S rRNA (adenine1518-N6/adenine1519-N6)-dimethyltransferase
MKKKARWGQNFLNDRAVAQRIIDAVGKAPDGPLLEIGPGKGILTEGLLAQGFRLMALEIDPGLCEELQRRFGGRENFRLIQGDAVRFDYSSLGRRFNVVSNLPYYAATHILKRLIGYRERIGGMTVMLQREVAQRLAAAPGEKAYSSLSVFAQYNCRVESLLDVSREAFTPRPKVASTVVRLTPHARPPAQVDCEKTFFRIVHAAFLHKRKMLRNNLREWHADFVIGHDQASLAGIDLSRRGETLSLPEFAVLANHVETLRRAQTAAPPQ